MRQYSIIIVILTSLIFILNCDNVLSAPSENIASGNEIGDTPMHGIATAEKFKEQCMNTTGTDDAYEEVVKARDQLKECVMSLGLGEFKQEMEKATEMDAVFHKYCPKHDQVVDCVKNFTKTVETCFEPMEQAGIRIVVAMLSSFIDFACEKDGDNIALFIAEKGPECIREKQSKLKDCVETSFKDDGHEETAVTVEDLLTFDAEDCREIETFKTCVVHVLEECEQLTIANIAESLFKHLHKKTPCSSETKPNDDSDFSTSTAAATFKEQCKNTTGSDAAYEEVVKAGHQLKECITSVVDVDEFKQDMEKATEMNTVFHKYCPKHDQAVECVKKFTETVEPCFEPMEQAGIKIIVAMLSSFIDFSCEKDGDNIAVFFAEKGPECLKEKQSKLKDCAETSFKDDGVEETAETVQDLLTFDAEDCKEIETFKTCVVHVLGECEHSSIANIADSLLKHVHKKTPCSNEHAADTQA